MHVQSKSRLPLLLSPKMSDEDKKRFIAAVTGADGKVNSKAAAALIAAAASGGDPEIANKESILDFDFELSLSNINFKGSLYELMQ